MVRSKIFAPRMLPTDRADCFLMMAVTVVTSSGRDVPMATMVTPMIRSETPARRARALALSTSRSAPSTTAAAPRENLTHWKNTARLRGLVRSGPRSPPQCMARFAPRMFSYVKTAKIASSGRDRDNPTPPRPQPHTSTPAAASISTDLRR